jgi:hypothetical protein
MQTGGLEENRLLSFSQNLPFHHKLYMGSPEDRSGSTCYRNYEKNRMKIYGKKYIMLLHLLVFHFMTLQDVQTS